MRRRTFIKSGGAATVAGLLAGCTSGSETEDPTSEPTTTESSATTEEPTTSEDSSYSVSIEPMGEVSFDSVPETWVANNGSWADMGVALGREPPEAVWLARRYHTQYYDEIDDISVDAGDMTSLYQGGVDKELFYSLDADVHVIDPNFLLNRFSGWSEGDVEEISDSVAPFFGNSIFSRGYGWHEDYQYYSLYEAFEKLAQVFQRTERYEAFESLHEDFQSRVSDVVPAEGERPSVAIMWAAGDEPTSFSPYLISEGTSFKQWRDLQVNDALAETDVRDFHASRAEVDFETLLEIDPDVLLLRGQEAKTAEQFQNTVVSFLEDDTTASDLTAVQNGDVYRGGPLYQGPITNLVLTERAARQVYGVEEELFDRDRVANIVNGDF
ncbi:ABC-type transport system periplasmic substrate-binding protein [Halobacterium hubeiense]|jgi:iron complex transport system substrate-binding protein|uniref:ABC-type transport system periplasmic substrate-binding protein n=2 Tax=Halobacterium TaxID=2239 RepID=A0A0U5H0H1_9EURY|nr:ABC transporter substrate-binding protein [Halobacterium hubeiense]CQH44743.1 ABC-type transport system periplasmic substrate-binding protein [Halobacterium hubeiense]